MPDPVVLDTGEKRADYIRRRFAELSADPQVGEKKARGVISKELNIAFQTVYAATRSPESKARQSARTKEKRVAAKEAAAGSGQSTEG